MSPNGRYILNDMEFTNKLKAMSDRELAEFSAELGYSNAMRLTTLEGRGKRTLGIAGGAGALLGGAIAGLIDFFVRR